MRHSLYDLLHAFRTPDRAVTLWIDAICIDQSSLQERNHQVRMIGEVFTKADRVNAWLGYGNKEYGKVLACFDESVKSQRDESWSLPESSSLWTQQCISLFQLREYWSRVWIVQELVLANDIMLFWNESSISWAGLLRLVSMFEKDKAPAVRAIAAMRMSYEGQRSFEELFGRFGHLQCALDHDRFYSLYGMVNDVSCLTSALPLPDYGLCITEVFMQQIQSRENQSPVRSPMGFVATFIRHFSQANIDRGPCDCHSESYVSIPLPFRGTIRKTSEASSYCVYRENDIYRFRRFKAEANCYLKEGDFAFALDSQQWNLVVRQSEVNHHQDVHIQSTAEAVGMVDHDPIGSSRCISMETCWGRIATLIKPQLKRQQTVLTVQMSVRMLITLAHFMQFPMAKMMKERYRKGRRPE